MVTLIGRRDELTALARLLDRGLAGTGGHIVVTGQPGSGRTALADAAVDLARSRGIEVHRGTAAPDLPVWHQILGALELPLPAGAEPEHAATAIAGSGCRLLVIDDIDKAGEPALTFLPVLASHLAAGATMLLVTTAESVRLTPELRLSGLTEPELATMLPGLSAAAVHAVWLVTGGLPGPARAVAASLPDPVDDVLTHLALTTPSRAGFLDLDIGLLRVLEAAVQQPLAPDHRARVLARLARELLGDSTAVERRRELIDEAESLARASGSPGTIAEVLDCRLHALWDPAAADERQATAGEIVEQARRAGDADAERRGLFWRFTALAELGELGAAESALTAYARAGEAVGDAEAAVVVLARQAMLATVRGRFAAAEALAGEMDVRGTQAGLPDTYRLAGSLRSAIAAMRGDQEGHAEKWDAMGRKLPGNFYEATAARVMAESGRLDDAELELERVLPSVLAGSGPRWLGAVADLAVVASHVGEPATAQALYDALSPYRGRLVVSGGANTITGPIDDYLGRLAIRLRRPEQAVAHLDSAATLEERIGALPWLANTLVTRAHALSLRDADGDAAAAREDQQRARSIAERLGMRGVLADPTAPDTWRLCRDGDDWRLATTTETAVLRDGRGIHYLRALLAAPGEEIAALDLVAGGAGLRVSPADPVLDDAARAAFRQRLAVLEDQLDAADRAGDVDRSIAVQAERTAVLAELRRASGLGGRPRAHSDEAERARVNATRTLWSAVKQIESAAPLAGAHLRSSLRTGRFFRYQPAPGGPARWQL